MQEFKEESRPTWFVFSGMGSQWAGMAQDLMKFQVFEQTIRRAADVLKKEGFDLYAVFRSNDESTFDNVLNSFVSIAVMQVSFFYFICVGTWYVVYLPTSLTSSFFMV